ncbi:MAG: 4a-hydroxytetrahydrobiopterin dehydratase [Patescibacteria group bacterium]
MTTPLHEQICVPCEGGVSPIPREEALARRSEIDDWTLSDDATSISREFSFTNFTEALTWVNKIGALAEQEGHHPDIHWTWNRVRLVLSTHAIGGLSNNDFILAAKINRL